MDYSGWRLKHEFEKGVENVKHREEKKTVSSSRKSKEKKENEGGSGGGGDMRPVATWGEFIERHYRGSERIPPFTSMENVGILPKHVILMGPTFFTAAVIGKGWSWKSPEEKKHAERVFEQERALAIAHVSDGEDSKIEWAPVTDWVAFGARYPDLERTIASVSSVYDYETVKDAIVNDISGGSVVDKLNRGLTKGNFLLLQAALRNEGNLTTWRSRSNGPWSPSLFTSVYEKRAAKGSDTVQKQLELKRLVQLDASLHTFWYYYVVLLTPPPASHRPRLSKKRSGSGGGGGGGGGGPPGGPRLSSSESEHIRRREHERAQAEVARLEAEERSAKERLWHAEIERQRVIEVDRFVEQLTALFPDKAAHVIKLLGIPT